MSKGCLLLMKRALRSSRGLILKGLMLKVEGRMLEESLKMWENLIVLLGKISILICRNLEVFK